MDIRYQVFVSSTFRDLLEERREVMQCLLEMDCIPAGMELFPAADDTAWQLIARAIDQSDYYVLIIGGRYGTTDKSGVSYTEREYDYAISKRKTVLPFLPEDPNSIPSGKSEMKEDAQEALSRFRTKVEEGHHCKYWNGPHDLGSKVLRAVNAAIKAAPGTGWVRGDQARRMEDLQQLAELQKHIASLTEENRSLAEAYKATIAKQAASLIPRIASELLPLVRQLRMRVELASADPNDPGWSGQMYLDAVRTCLTAYEELVELGAEIDQYRRFPVYASITDVLRILDRVRNSGNAGYDEILEWQRDAALALAKLDGLVQQVENEDWRS